MLERQIENKVCEYAKKRGWLVYKWTSPQNRGVPDRILFFEGMALAIEFKQKNKPLTALQCVAINELREHGVAAFVVDDIDEGKNIIDYFTSQLMETHNATIN